MPIDVAGAAVGAAFNELLSLVNHLVANVAAFSGQLKKIHTTLGNIEPIIEDIDKFNNLLGRSLEEMRPIKDLLEEGQRLVSKCSKIGKFNPKKYAHSRKLTSFNSALLERFQIYTQLPNARDGKEALVEVKKIWRCVELLISKIENSRALCSGIEACCSCDARFHCRVRGEGEARGAIARSVRAVARRRSVLVAIPGGCGKNILLKKLCHEAAIEDVIFFQF